MLPVAAASVERSYVSEAAMWMDLLLIVLALLPLLPLSRFRWQNPVTEPHPERVPRFTS
jgi:hypothetical protein